MEREATTIEKNNQTPRKYLAEQKDNVEGIATSLGYIKNMTNQLENSTTPEKLGAMSAEDVQSIRVLVKRAQQSMYDAADGVSVRNLRVFNKQRGPESTESPEDPEQAARKEEQEILLNKLREDIGVIESCLGRAAKGQEAIVDGGMEKLKEISSKLREIADFLEVL